MVQRDERPQSTINPQAFALQAGLNSVPKKKAPVVSSQAPMQSSLQPQPMQSQAPTVATPKPVVTPKIGGIAPTFGATNINAQPTLGGATPQEVQKQQQIINSQPKTPAILPETGSEQNFHSPQKVDYIQSIKDLKETLNTSDSLDDIRGVFPEFSKLDDSALADLIATTRDNEDLDDILGVFPELNKSVGEGNILTDNFITDLGSGIGQSVANYGKLGKKAGIAVGNKIRQWLPNKEKYTPEELSAMYDNSDTTVDQLTNRQTPEQKKTTAGAIGETVGTVGQALVMPTGVSSLEKIPAIAKAVQKAPVISSMIKGGLQGIVGQEQYNLATEGKMSSGKELATAGVIGAAIPGAGAAAKGIMKGVKKLPQFFGKQAENLAVKGLLNTSDAKNILRTLDETADGDVGSIGRRALEKDVAGKPTEEAIKTLQKIHGDTYEKVRDVVDDVSNKMGPIGKNADVEKSMELVTSSMNKANKDIGYQAYDLAEAKAIQEAAKDGTLTLKQAQKSKELIDEFQNIYKKSQDVLSTQLAKEGAKLRTNIRKLIEDKVTIGTDGAVNLKELNRDVSVAKAFEKGITSKSVANELKQFAIQGSIGGFVGNQGDFSSPEGIAKFLVGAFMGRQVGKFLGNPATLGKIAKQVDKLSMGSRKSLLQYIKNPKTAVLTKDAIDELTDIKTNLSLPYYNDVNTSTTSSLVNTTSNNRVPIKSKIAPNSTVPVKASEEVLSKPKTKVKPSVEKGFEGGIIKGKTDTAFDKSMSDKGYEISDINSSKGKIGNKYVKTLPNGQKIEVLYTYKTVNGIDDGEIILKIREKNGGVDGGKSYIDKGAFANDLISFEKIPEVVPVKSRIMPMPKEKPQGTTISKVPVKESNPLLAEAKKYKSADEFVDKFKKNTYDVTNVDSKVADSAKEFNRKYTSQIKDSTYIKELKAKKEAIINDRSIDTDTMLEKTSPINKEITQYYESQLKQIREEANGKTKVKPKAK